MNYFQIISHLFVTSFPEYGEDVDGTDRGRQVAGDGLYVMEELAHVLDDGQPDHANDHKNNDTASAKVNRRK